MKLDSVLEGTKKREHLCSIYESTEEHYAVSIPFIRMGLEREEKCLYVADEGTETAVRQALGAEGVDVNRALATKALVLLTKAQSYLRDGSFDPDRTFEFLKEATAQAKKERFSALRVTGETEWILRGAPGLEQWIEYESRFSKRLLSTGCFALCQYNRRHFTPAMILNVIRAHPVVIHGVTVYCNCLHVSPEECSSEDYVDSQVDRYLEHMRQYEAMSRVLEQREKELHRADSDVSDEEKELQQAMFDRYRSLTRREKGVMSLTVRGMLNKQVAGLLGITEFTVKVHRRHVMEKMHASSLPELVLIAETIGVLDRSEYLKQVQKKCKTGLAEPRGKQ